MKNSTQWIWSELMMSFATSFWVGIELKCRSLPFSLEYSEWNSIEWKVYAFVAKFSPKTKTSQCFQLNSNWDCHQMSYKLPLRSLFAENNLKEWWDNDLVAKCSQKNATMRWHPFSDNPLIFARKDQVWSNYLFDQNRD